jgi:hypothetical protein
MSYTRELTMKLASQMFNFVPDKIEIKLERHRDEYELAYSEWFTFIPSDIAQFIISLAKKAYEKELSLLNLQLDDEKTDEFKIVYKGKLDKTFRETVERWVLREAILFASQNQEDANEMIESLCSERSNENLCAKPDSGMACKGLIVREVIREWTEKLEIETREKVKKAKAMTDKFTVSKPADEK